MTVRQPIHEPQGQLIGDDFTRIRGIGPGIANRLQNAGILRFTQLASLSAEEIVSATGGLIGLTVERVEQQDWAGQARDLSEAEFEVLTDDSGLHLHYAIFTAELLMDENNRVLRTRLVDVRAGAEEAWAGWEPDRLMRFLMDQSRLLVEARPAEEQQDIGSAAPEDQDRDEALPGTMEITAVTILDANTAMRTRILPSNSPFTLKVTLDLSQTGLPVGALLHCHTTIQAKLLSGSSRLILAEWNETVQAHDETELSADHPGLPYGIYRLEAAVVANAVGEYALHEKQLAAFLEGEILQMY